MIIQINGKSLIGLSHENALQLLKGEPEECMFVIRRQTAHPQVRNGISGIDDKSNMHLPGLDKCS